MSKWIEKGKKNCPLCRKEIQENVNSINRGPHTENRAEDYVFRFSLSSRFFSWIPNLTIRLGRTGPNSVNNLNNNSHNINM